MDIPFVAEYVKKTPESRKLFERSQKRLLGGNTRAAVYFKPYPLYLRKGSGSKVWDIDGNELTDFHNNYSALILGHANPKVVTAVSRRVKDGMSFGAPTEYEYELANLVSERMRSIRRMRFCNSGTEATMYTLLAAKAFTKRRKILKFEGGYHGSHEYALVSTHPPLGWEKLPQGRQDADGVSQSILREVLVAPFNNQEAVARIFDSQGSEIAGVIVEPVMGAAGMRPARKDFLQFLREVTDKNGSLLIFDEIITGFRLARGGAQENYGIYPDLTALGKNLGGGLPVGGYGGREDVMELFDVTKDSRISLSGTFSANPVTMVAGLETLKQLTHETYAKLNGNGETLERKLLNAISDSGVQARVTRAGALLNVHFTESEVFDYRSAKSEDANLKYAFFMGLLTKGILTATRGMASISVPMRSHELQTLAEASQEILVSLRSATSHRELVHSERSR